MINANIDIQAAIVSIIFDFIVFFLFFCLTFGPVTFGPAGPQ